MCKTNDLLNNEIKVLDYINYQTGEKLNISRVKSLSENAMLKVKPSSWCEWDFEKNEELGLDIWKLTKGLHKKTWWKCLKCESSYDATIINKMKSKGCSYCAGRKVNHTNCIATTHPHLLSEWDYSGNNTITPYDVARGSREICYWFCKKCNNIYDAKVQHKVKGLICPYCNGKRINNTNSLASLKPELASQWHPTKNGDLTPHNVAVSSAKKVWWLGECGHEWDSYIYSRNKGHQCPYCTNVKTNHTNSLASLKPELAKEWHPTKNGNLTPYDKAPNSNQKVWWLGNCGHQWKALISSRNNGGNGCPYCSNTKLLLGFNDMWTTNPELAKLLANPEDGYKYMQNSHNKVNWKCPNCKEDTTPKRIQDVNNQGLSCVNCSNGISFPERLVFKLLSNLNVEFDFQKTFKWANNRRYDFEILQGKDKYLLEVNGLQHYSTSFVNIGGRTLEQEIANDKYKYDLAITNGIKPENYIVIDARKSKFEFIKNNILNSRLTEVFDLSNVDWEELNTSMKTPLLLEICGCWDAGMSIRNIIEVTQLSRHTIIKYLKRGNEINICRYNAKEEIILNNSKNSKEVIGINDDSEVVVHYSSINQARKDLNISHNRMIKICTSKEKFNELIWKIK